MFVILDDFGLFCVKVDFYFNELKEPTFTN